MVERIFKFALLLLRRIRWRWAAAKKYLLLVFESLGFLANDAICKVICLVDICGKPDGHELFSILLFEVAQVSWMWLLLLLVNLRVMAHGRHWQEVPLAELIAKGNREVKRAIPEVIVIILILVNCFHERNWAANLACNFVENEARAFVEDESSLPVFRAVTRYLPTNHKHSVYRNVLLVESKLRNDLSIDQCFCGAKSIRHI